MFDYFFTNAYEIFSLKNLKTSTELPNILAGLQLPLPIFL